MIHLVASRRLSAYLDGELAPGERLAVERHLGRCPRCASRLEDLGRLRGALRSLSRSAPPEGGWSRLREEMAGAARGRPRPSWQRATARRWVPLTATAALLAAASLYLVLAPAPPPGSPASLMMTDLIEEEPLPLSPSIELVLVARGDGGADRGEEP